MDGKPCCLGVLCSSRKPGVLQKAVLPKGIMCNLITSYADVYKDKSKCFKWQHLNFGVFFMNKVFMVTWETCITTVG